MYYTNNSELKLVYIIFDIEECMSKINIELYIIYIFFIWCVIFHKLLSIV